MSVSLNSVVQANNAQPIKQLTTPEDDKKSKSIPIKTTVVVGTGLAALAAIGIYIATRGKGSKIFSKDVTEVTQKPQEVTNAIKEMTVDAFKKAGNKFNKGKAVTNTGEAFTGNITRQTKDGKKIVLEYKNGVLNNSTKYDGENVLSQKKYNFSENGDFTIFEGENLLLIKKTEGSISTIQTKNALIRKDVNTGRIKTLQIKGQGKKDFYYSGDGTLKAVKHHYHAKDGTIMHDTVLYSPEGNKKMKIGADGMTEFYDKNGVSIDKIQVDIYRGNSSLYYHDLSYSKSLALGKVLQTYSYEMPQGSVGIIFKDTKIIAKGKKEVSAKLLLTTPDNKEYIVSRNGKDIKINRNGEKVPLVKNSDEYKAVLAQSSEFMKQFFAKYKTALELQRQVNEGLKEIA